MSPRRNHFRKPRRSKGHRTLERCCTENNECICLPDHECGCTGCKCPSPKEEIRFITPQEED